MTSSDATRTTLPGLFSSAPEDQTAVILPELNIRITYGGLRRQVEALAETLAGCGIGRGDRVGMALPNGLPTIVSFLAASVAGTAAPLNPAYKEDEFRFYLEDTNARVLLLPPGGAEEARRAAGDRVRVLPVEMSADGAVSIAGATARRAVELPAVDDVALVLHTSGSTGRPKRVPLTHVNLSISARNVARTYALTSDDVSLCVMPLFHVHGLMASTLGTLATGAPSSCSANSIRCRSGVSHRIVASRGIPPCRCCTSCCSRVPTPRRADPRVPNDCASSDRAARRWRRRSCTTSKPRSARPCSKRTA